MPSCDYIISVRGVKSGAWTNEPGPTRWLRVPSGSDPDPSFAATSEADRRKLVDEILMGAGGANAQGVLPPDPGTGQPPGDLLVFVHGYNNSVGEVIVRHRKIRAALKGRGYAGEVLSFDWPSGTSTLAYLEDRSDAKQTAFRLVEDCISVFATRVRAAGGNCGTNVHLLGHSTGAYVIREAFDDADDRFSIAQVGWLVNQAMFIAGDISSSSMSSGDASSRSLMARCRRITNYSNPYDEVLNISNAKRLFISARVGRVGLPSDAPSSCVDVNCGGYYASLKAPKSIIDRAAYSHSWYFDDPNGGFYDDVVSTISGSLDRNVIPTRRVEANGRLALRV
ncbi:MAG: alpha/beta fold hydrolase [Phycisphaerae bacterium]|nr:alpha/beta fold hydrolase [Phycisphaerae bacterium]